MIRLNNFMMGQRSKLLNKGYSLIEVVIILFVLSTILLVTIPPFHSNVKKMEMDYFLKELEQDLYYYQLYAMTNGRNVRFLFSPSDPSYRVLEGVRTIHENQGPNGLSFRPRTLDLNELRFLANGYIQKAGKIEILYLDDHYLLVFQLLRGRFYFEKI